MLPERPLQVVLHRRGELSLFEMQISLPWVDLDPEVGLVGEEAALSCTDNGFKFTSRDVSWPSVGKGTILTPVAGFACQLGGATLPTLGQTFLWAFLCGCFWVRQDVDQDSERHRWSSGCGWASPTS